MRINDIITESFVNAVGFGPEAMELKRKYADEVWDILQKSYAPIGGLAGSGFESKEDMISSIPLWKIIRQDGIVRGVIMYKDKGGRKSVAMGTDGSIYARRVIRDAVAAEVTRAYGEKSKASLALTMKAVPWETLQNYLTKPEDVSKVLPGKEIVAIKDLPEDEWPEDAKTTLAKYPHLIDYGYVRNINGSYKFKVLVGSPNKPIK